MTPLFSKQLLIGLACGAMFAGLGFMLFGGAGVPEITVSDSGNERLLAQVIPGEEVPVSTEGKDETVSDDNVIEVRSVSAKATAKAPAKKATAVIEEDEVADEEEVVAVEATKCSYVTGDKPELKGIISEVAWMGAGDDANAEWVEMQNHTKGELDVSGWQLVDKAEQIRAIVPADSVLLRSGFMLFERDEHQLSGVTVLYKGALSNTDEGVRLFDADCQLQDEIIAKSKWPAGTNVPKYTAERGKDLSWHTFYGDADAGIFGTPGEKNSAGPPEPAALDEGEPRSSEDEPEPEQPAENEPIASSTDSEVEDEPETPVIVPVTAGQLIISEVMAGDSAGAGNEFIELYNTTDVEIDLTGFSIKKKVLSSGSESSLVTTVNFEGKKVPAGGRFLIGHGTFAGQSQMTWPTSYSIAYSGNAALLYNTQGEKIDEVSWTLSASQSYVCASQGSCAVADASTPGN